MASREVKGSVCLGYGAASMGDWCPLFRGKLMVSTSRVETSMFEV